MRYTKRLPADLCAVAAGRTGLGIPFAHFVAGSEVISTHHALTIGGAVARAQRDAMRHTGKRVRHTS